MPGKWLTRERRLTEALKSFPNSNFQEIQEIHVPNVTDVSTYPENLPCGCIIILKSSAEVKPFISSWTMRGFKKNKDDIDVARLTLKKQNFEARLVQIDGIPDLRGIWIEDMNASSKSEESEEEADADLMQQDIISLNENWTDSSFVQQFGHQTIHGNLKVNGNGYFENDVSCTRLFQRSDRNYKTEIKELVVDFRRFLEKEAYRYKWKDGDDNCVYGLLTQEFAKDFPELVRTDSKGGQLLDYSGVVAVLFSTVKYLDSRVQNLEKERKNELELQLLISRELIKGYVTKSLTSSTLQEFAAQVRKTLDEPMQLLPSIKKVNDRSLVSKWVDQSLNDALWEGNPSMKSKKPGGRFFALLKNWEKSRSRINGRHEFQELRPYQLEAVEEIQKNDSTLVVIPTGAGKTRIASEVIKLYLIPGSPLGNQCALFIVRDAVLVDQQQRVLRSVHPKLDEPGNYWNIGAFCGGGYRYINDENLGSTSIPLKQMMRKCHAVVATAGSIERVQTELEWHKIPVVVFDEVHNARGKSSYSKILNHIQTLQTKPKILGLTASPGCKATPDATKVDIENRMALLGKNTKVFSMKQDDKSFQDIINRAKIERYLVKSRNSNIDESISKLDEIVETLRDEIFSKHCTILRKKTDEENDEYLEPPSPEKEQISGSLLKWTKKVLNKLRENNVDLNEIHRCELLEKLCEISLSARDLDVLDILYSLIEALGYAISQNFDDDSKEILTKSIKIFVDMIDEEETNPKTTELIRLIEERSKLNKDFRAIVRVETRITARKLTAKLSHLFPSEILLGRGRRFNDSNFSRAEMETNLQAFQNNECKVLVCTSVIQEGVDVQSCDLVVCYNIQTTSCGTDFIQLSGRARKQGGVFAVLLQGIKEELALDTAICQVEHQEEVLVQISKQSIF